MPFVDETIDTPSQYTEPEAPGWFQPGSKSEAVVRGASNAATLGAGKYIAGGVQSLLNDTSWGSENEAERNANQASMDTNPGSYAIGNVLGGAPMGFAGAGKGLVTNAALNVGTPAITTALDTGDVGQTAKAAAMGAAFPTVMAALKPVATVAGKVGGKVLDKVSDVIGVPQAAVEQVATDVGKVGTTGAKITPQIKNTEGLATNLVKKFGGADYEKQLNDAAVKEAKKIGITPGTPVFDQFKTEFATKFDPTLNHSVGSKLQESVLNGGMPAVPDELKSFITNSTPNAGPWDVIKNGYKGMGIGAVAGGQGGSLVGMPGTGAAIGGALGGASAVKKSLVNREVHKQLGSPLAQEGAKQINAKMAAATDVATNPARFGVISNFLNQTSPAARAEFNPENPGND